jgi:hypothetical protein
MGAVETTYTFGATDTITSAKMNNIIDQTTMTSDACLSGGGLQVADGQLSISNGAINNSRLATNSVTSSNIVDGTIVNADINASAAIAGTKIAPNFGSQNIVTTGTIDAGLSSLGYTFLKRANTTSEGGDLAFAKAIDNTVGFTIDCFGSTSSPDLRFIAGPSVVATLTTNGDLGIGTSNPVLKFHVVSGSGTARFESNTIDNFVQLFTNEGADNRVEICNRTGGRLALYTAGAGDALNILKTGEVGIGTTTPSSKLQVNGTATATAFAGPLTGNVTGDVTGNVTGDVTGSSGSCTGNSATATNLSTNSSNWSTNGTISAVVGQLAWKQFGNNHTVFDASAATTPSGTACSQINADIGWYSGLPTLMGWNGTSTHGVRVDSAKFADSATTASTVSNSAITAAKLDGNQSGSAPIYGCRAWVNFDATRDSSGATNTLNTNRFIRSSGNITSVKKEDTGRYTVTFSIPFPSGNTSYTVICTSGQSNTLPTASDPRFSFANRTTATSSSIQIVTNNSGGSSADYNENNVMVIG